MSGAPIKMEWAEQELWMQLIYEERLEEVVAMVLNGHVDPDIPLPSLDEIGTDVPPFIPQPTMVRWKGGDTALHFALREQKRDSVSLLVELGVAKEGDTCLNSHDEDPRMVAQTIDHYQDAAQCGDFDPLEPLLDPFETVHVAVASFQRELPSKLVSIDVRLKPASPAASKALIQCAGDTTESFFKKLNKAMVVNMDVQTLWFEGAELMPGETLQLNGLYQGCHLWLLRKKDPINVHVRGWTGAAVKNLMSPGCPVADHSFVMRVGLRDQFISYGAEHHEFLSNPIAELQQQVLEMDHIQPEDQVLEALELATDGERLQQMRAAVAAAAGTEEQVELQSALSELVKKIEAGAHLVWEDMSGHEPEPELRKYQGLLEGCHRFGAYALQPEQVVLVSPPFRRAPKSSPKRISMWFDGKPDNVGAAFVKVRHSESAGMPLFVDAPCWSGEEIVAYGNLNAGKWEADLAANPKDVYAMRRLGRARAAVGGLEEAVALYSQAIAIDPEYHYAKRDLAMAHFLLGERAQALLGLRELLSGSHPRYTQAWCDLGDILASEGDWGGAQEHYQKALDTDLSIEQSSTATAVPTTSGRAAALRGLGCCACARNRLKQGLALLQQALELAPSDHVATQMVQLASGHRVQLGDQQWREHSRLAMISGQMLCTDPTQAAHAAKLLQAGIRGDPKKQQSKADMLKLGSALFMKQGSVHAAEAGMF